MFYFLLSQNNLFSFATAENHSTLRTKSSPLNWQMLANYWLAHLISGQIVNKFQSIVRHICLQKFGLFVPFGLIIGSFTPRCVNRLQPNRAQQPNIDICSNKNYMDCAWTILTPCLRVKRYNYKY